MRRRCGKTHVARQSLNPRYFAKVATYILPEHDSRSKLNWLVELKRTSEMQNILSARLGFLHTSYLPRTYLCAR